ncbi:MAG TPA: hypothetical protein VFR85_04360 [Anaeromyxobacteraceae bacterium]|nr:hypothetical protein [Anaeromyxobacteraceae bacterium]
MIPLAAADPWQSYVAAVRRLPDLAEAVSRLPWPVAAGAIAAGVVALGFGARARRPLAVVGGALVGLAAGAALAGWIGDRVAVPGLFVGAVCALGLGMLAGLWPLLFIFAAGALPGALAGAALPQAGQPWYGLLGLAVGGLMAVGLTRWVAAVTAAGLGAALLGVGVFGLAGGWAPARALAGHPLALVAVLAVLTVSGAAFQHASAWRPPARRLEGETRPDEAATVVQR